MAEPRKTRNNKKEDKKGSPNADEMFEPPNDGQAPDTHQSELANITSLLHTIAADVSSVKTSVEALQITVEKLGTRMAEAETRISDLEDANKKVQNTLGPAVSNIKKLQEKVTYLEDAGRRNNVRVTGIPENAEKPDLNRFVLALLADVLDLNVDSGFELERAHRVGPERADVRNRHILIRFLRFSSREAVLRAAREKRRVEWRGNKISFYQDLSQEVLQQRRKFDTVKKQFHQRGLLYSMLYPASLKVTVNNRSHIFTSPDAAAEFLEADG